MYFMGVDQSLTNTGICILDNNGNPIKLFSLTSNQRGIERLAEFYSNFMNELLELGSDYICATEGYSYGSGKSNGKEYSRHTQAGELKAVLELAIYFDGGYCVSYAPSSHRSKTIRYTRSRKGGSSKEFKHEIVELVNKFYGLELKKSEHNIADAVTIAKALYHDFVNLKLIYSRCLETEVTADVYHDTLSKTPFQHYDDDKMKRFEEKYFD